MHIIYIQYIQYTHVKIYAQKYWLTNNFELLLFKPTLFQIKQMSLEETLDNCIWNLQQRLCPFPLPQETTCAFSLRSIAGLGFGKKSIHWETFEKNLNFQKTHLHQENSNARSQLWVNSKSLNKEYPWPSLHKISSIVVSLVCTVVSLLVLDHTEPSWLYPYHMFSRYPTYIWLYPNSRLNVHAICGSVHF